MEKLSPCGWATVQVDESGKLIRACYGLLPFVRQSILAAELWAILQLLQNLDPRERWHTMAVDNATALNGLRKGQRYCTAAARPCAHIWRMIWHEVEDRGITFAANG